MQFVLTAFIQVEKDLNSAYKNAMISDSLPNKFIQRVILNDAFICSLPCNILAICFLLITQSNIFFFIKFSALVGFTFANSFIRCLIAHDHLVRHIHISTNVAGANHTFCT